MAPTLNAPSPENYRVGKGIGYFKPTGSENWIDLGNCPEIEFTPAVENLDHFSARTGVRTKDRVITLQRSGTLRIVMEEFTAQNLSMVLMGSVDENGPDGPEVEILSQDAVSGEFRFLDQNDTGPRTNFHFYNVTFTPSSAISLISDEWGNMEANGEALIASAGENAGKVGRMWISNIEGYGGDSS